MAGRRILLMRFVWYSPSFAAGAAGLFTGLVYHKISNNRQFLISAANPVSLEIDGIISKDVEAHVNKYTPIMKHGFPSYDTLRLKENFIISYDRRNRVPNWVMEHLTSGMIEGDPCVSRRNSYEDKTIHDYFRSTSRDYRNSGYDKGHLAAAANHKHCQRAHDDTFVLSNMTPQNCYFNQGIWHTLERHVRNLVKRYGSVYVCSGPLYLPREIILDEEEFPEFSQKQQKKQKRQRNHTQTKTKKYVIYEVIGKNNVAVPTHFFKIIVCEADNNVYDMEAYIIPNQRAPANQSLSSYMVPRDAIERAAGFLLFHQLPSKTFRYINGEKSEMESPMDL